MGERKILDWNNFPYYKKALTLLVLVQISSHSVESVFSCLSLIREICGGNILEDITDLHVMLQCNGYLEDLLLILEG